MPATPHVERHFSGSEIVRDIVIGMSDGLTVPFALAAGLSGVVDRSGVVVAAGLAEIAAGSIAMGLGGFLAGKSDQEHYDSEQRREEAEVREKPEQEAEEVRGLLHEYGLGPAEIEPVVAALRVRPDSWVKFMMQLELGLEQPKRGRATRSALTIGISYIAGGAIPLAPYLFFSSSRSAFPVSVGVTVAALAVFGYVKGLFTGGKPLRSALQTTMIGGLAAGAAFGLAKLFA